MSYRQKIIAWQILILILVGVVWEWGFSAKEYIPSLVPDLLDPYFVSKPSAIGRKFLEMSCLRASGSISFDMEAISSCLARNRNNLWVAASVTIQNTLIGFVWGVVSGFILGVALGRSRVAADILNPYLVAFNSIPRIALAPLVLLAFGIGAMSKIFMAWMVVIFVVFFNTLEGVRQVDRDHISGARLLGASQWQILSTIIVPSAMTWLFASLSPSISFALIGVIVGEFIGSEFGIGRVIIEAEARGDASGMMVAIIVLMIVGMILGAMFQKLQNHLLRWQVSRSEDGV